MDLEWIFLGISAGFPWIWRGFSTDFMDVRWISMDLDWIFYGFHESGVDFSWNFGWISMDLAWIFYGFHRCRVDFHGVDIDE